MDMHRASRIPQYEATPSEDRTLVQRVAVWSHGVLAPANLVTAFGLFLTGKGLIDISRGDKTKGLVELCAGDVCDAVDGWAAKRWQTIGPVGEMFDTVADKVKAAGTLAVLSHEGIVPARSAVAIGAQNAANAVVAVSAKWQGRELHPSREAKCTSGLQKAAVELYVASDIAFDYEFDGAADARNKADVATVAAMVLGVFATGRYIIDTFKPLADDAPAVTA
jgi:phosphatidylglycerophosphate synthase